MLTYTPNYPIEGNLGESKDSRAKEFTFYDLFPLNSLFPNEINTSGIVKWPAIVRAFKKFLNPSFLG